MKILNKSTLVYALAMMMVFGVWSTVQAAESPWQSLNPSMESGLSGTVYNCSPAVVANGNVAPYPVCTITCNANYSLNGSECQQISGSSGGGGGGGGGSFTNFCTSVSYSDWSTCVNSLQTRTVTAKVTSDCILTTQQQSALQQACTVTPITPAVVGQTGAITSGIGMFKIKRPGTIDATASTGGAGQVLGVKVYPDGTLIRYNGSPRVYVIVKGKPVLIRTLMELRKYAGQKIINLNTDGTEYNVLGEKVYPNGTLLRSKNTGKYYIVVKGQRQHVKTVAELLKYRNLKPVIVD